MPRPTEPCARCVRDLTPGCDHLANCYDKFFLKNPDATEQDLVIYALNRMLALDRDNGNKAAGEPASRIYKSRNTKVFNILANLCGAQGPRGARCIRQPHPEDPGRHRF